MLLSRRATNAVTQNMVAIVKELTKRVRNGRTRNHSNIGKVLKVIKCRNERALQIARNWRILDRTFSERQHIRQMILARYCSSLGVLKEGGFKAIIIMEIARSRRMETHEMLNAYIPVNESTCDNIEMDS